MKTVSVSEILNWRHCRRQWDFSYRQRLASMERAVQLASGTAVHNTIQTILESGGGLEPLAEHFLAEELRQRFNPEADLAKYLPGVLSALAKVPEWVWTTKDWHVEELHQVVLREDNYNLADGGGVSLRFKPDLYRVYADETQPDVRWLDIYDFKTGKKDALAYHLASPQLAYYAVGLLEYYHQQGVEVIPRISYISLPTQGKGPVEYEPWVLSGEQLGEARDELIQGIEEVGVGYPWPNRGMHCGFCDYEKVCSTRMMGGDWQGVLDANFYRRPESE